MDDARNTPLELPSLGTATRIWARIALLSFGGPAGQIALMHRVLVDEQRWIGETRFLHALNYCMLLPGPEAQQLATYIGWLMHRMRGGLIAGGLFVLPGFLAILALSIVYVRYGTVPVVAALFFGLKSAVLAIVLEALQRIAKRALKTRAALLLAGVAFIAIFFLDAPFPLIVLGAGIVGYASHKAGLGWFSSLGGHAAKAGAPEEGLVDRLLARDTPDHIRPNAARALRLTAICLILWLLPVAGLYASAVPGAFTDIGSFFAKMAVVTFGGAYAVLAYVAQEAVQHYGWLAPGEMLDGLGLAETTPGPLIMVLQFVGFLGAYRAPGGLDPMLAGILGSLLTVWVTFVPSFLWIFVGGPYVEAVRGNKALSAALAAITASVVGVILNLAVWFALHTLFAQQQRVTGWGVAFDLPVPISLDVPAAVLGVIAALALFRFHQGVFRTLAGTALLGVAWAFAIGGL